MATMPASSEVTSQAAETISALIAAEGSATHNYPSSDELTKSRFATRNLADVVHHLSVLHGRHPGVVDFAATRTTNPHARSWVLAAVDGFAIERTFLTRLVVAAGPLPSTPGHAQAEAAVNGQRHALEMLARSDRDGCALGAAATFVIDWHALRPVLVAAATRLSVEAPRLALPDCSETFTMIAGVADTPAIERAISFGAQQLLAQHRGLWDLLEARQIARGEY
jgi:hypothetical protein